MLPNKRSARLTPLVRVCAYWRGLLLGTGLIAGVSSVPVYHFWQGQLAPDLVQTHAEPARSSRVAASIVAPGSQPSPKLQCQPQLGATALSDSPADQFAQQWVPVVNTWATALETNLSKTVGEIVPRAIAHTNPSPWPQIHPRAQQGKVPIVMYHDILPEIQVFFDVTPEKLEADFQHIKDQNLTPISLQHLVTHLRTGIPLPEKPILLTFDDGYQGHYDYVYPLLKKFGYPATFSIFTAKVEGDVVGRSTVTWDQLREMAADPLITIAAHSVTHPPDLTQVPSAQLQEEVVASKQLLEEKLGIPIRYFTYPEGKHNPVVVEAVAAAGYQAALAMDDLNEQYAGESPSLLAIARFGQSRLADVMPEAWGGPPLPPWGTGFQFQSPIQLSRLTLENTPLILISGGRPITIHAKSRYQVPEILAGTEAIAAVDGGFFSMEQLDTNVMIGPVLSRHTQTFVPGNASENPKLRNRPLVLMSEEEVSFIPFQPEVHNTLAGIQAELPNVTDAFVGAGWLVKQGEPQAAETFGKLPDFEVARHRAFWGINTSGQPVIGVSEEAIDAMALGKLLVQVGFRDAIMLDSGASTSLSYQGESLVNYIPRPVPHVVALVPPQAAAPHCAGVTQTTSNSAELGG